MGALFSLLVGLVSAVVVLTTLAPLSASEKWWIRGWEFPRVQIAVVAGLCAVLAPFAFEGPVLVSVIVAMSLCAGFQVFKVIPFTPLWRKDLSFGEPSEDDVTLSSLNVEMTNDRYEDVIAEIRRNDPDAVLLMETDETWEEKLEPLLARYDTVVRHTLDNFYGMIFATRLPVRSCGMRELTAADTPTLFAELEDRNGRVFRLVGLHPRPPVPGEDTGERDQQIIYSARFARNADTPVIVIGDFNDVAWSYTSRRFRHYGAYLDVRVGRGLFSTFHARYRWFRCPIDQLFTTAEVVVSDFGLGNFVGSDHFPIFARVRLDAEEASRLAGRVPALDSDTERALDRAVADYEARLGRTRDAQKIKKGAV